nr:uncharacterized protein LOC115491081 isoform X1 [Taeniopygia guttata]
MQGECWAGWELGKVPWGFKARVRAGTLMAGHCPLGWGKRCLELSAWQVPKEALGTLQVSPAHCSLPARHAEPSFFHQAMYLTVAFILALLATCAEMKVNLKIEKDEVKQLLEHEEYLHQEMIQLLQEIEGSTGTMEALLCSALEKQWLLWVSAAVLVQVLAMGCWLVRTRKRGSAIRRRQEGSSRKEKGLPSTKVLQELVEELLGVCQVLSRRSFMPELHPAAGMDTSPTCSVQESSITYRTPVILQPPPGHSFSTESRKWPPGECIRVGLECLCSGEQLLGHTCFLHASGGQLPRDQEWYLMDTLCTGSYLDPEKVTHWVQMLVASAWLLLPHSRHFQLTALPCGKSCRFRLSGASGLHCSIEMVLAVQQGSSCACLSLEQAAAGSASSTVQATELPPL